MLRSLTAKQFIEWEHYARLEPFDELRADYRTASIREMLHNMAVVAKHRKPLDYFLLKYGDAVEDEPEQRQGQTWQEKKAVAYSIALAYTKPGVKSSETFGSEQKARAMADAIMQAYMKPKE